VARAAVPAASREDYRFPPLTCDTCAMHRPSINVLRASFYDFAPASAKSLSQTQSRLQMAEEVGTFLAALDLD